MKKITFDTLKAFLTERPSISKRGLEREANLPVTKIKEVLSRKQHLSEEQKERLVMVLKRYGWNLR